MFVGNDNYKWEHCIWSAKVRQQGVTSAASDGRLNVFLRGRSTIFTANQLYGMLPGLGGKNRYYLQRDEWPGICVSHRTMPGAGRVLR